MTKNPDLDLSYPDEEDEPISDVKPKGREIEVIKGIDKVDEGINAAAGFKLTRGTLWGKKREQDLRSRGQSGMCFGGSLILEVKKGVSLLTSHTPFCNFKTF